MPPIRETPRARLTPGGARPENASACRKKQEKEEKSWNDMDEPSACFCSFWLA